MSTTGPYARLGLRVAALVAVAFGLATVAAGGRVLARVDPAYVVFGPLVVYNTFMGAAYVVAGIITLYNPLRGRYAAGLVFLLNVLVLVVVWYLHTTREAVAAESVGAMALRTIIWLLLFVAIAMLARRNQAPGRH